ncbi:ERF family protein, partial [Salmonella enterica subsp. enterica serovar Anatum]|nr:ERF family protein [Salmonella enterica subsp. enterica serovar Anatum]
IKYGLIPNLSDEVVQIGDRYYIKATASISDGIKTISSTGLAREEENKKGMDGSQITGTASSYARKYAMNGLYQIDDTKDADSDEFKNQQDKNSNSQQDNKASDKQVGMLKSKVIEYSKVRGGDKSQLEEFLMNTFTVKDI